MRTPFELAGPLPHWNFFIALEEDLDRLSRYVEISEINNAVYSIEIARLFLSACSEIDVVLKQLVQTNNSNSGANSINSYFPEIIEHHPDFLDFEILLPKYNQNLKPWKNWTAGVPPNWWTSHNKVKHHRHTHFQEATLENCLLALSALFICTLYLYKNETINAQLLPSTRLFIAGNEHRGEVAMHRYGMSFSYNL